MESPLIVLEDGINLRDVMTRGSVLHINQDYDDNEEFKAEPEQTGAIPIDFIGEPVTSITELEKTLAPVDAEGLVKKRIIVEGGGTPLQEGFTVFVAFTGYWEKDIEPFDVKTVTKPMEVNLKDHGLLPGLEMAVKSMLVGETSIFLLSYKVMYGEIGIPPRIKPKSDCIFYIKLIKSIITPIEGKILFSEPNMFHRVHHEVKMLYGSSITLFKSNNFTGAIQLFKKGVNMLHKCRLADEKEEEIQEKLLIKLYINLVVCYNKINNPYKACTACNELNRLNSMWNNGKVLFQNAKALRMIGEYTQAEKRLNRALKMCPESKEMKAELELLIKTREKNKESKDYGEKVIANSKIFASDEFKKQIDNIIRNFKNCKGENQLVFPGDLNSEEMEYLKQVCIRENLFFNKSDINQVQSKWVQPIRSEVEDLVLRKSDKENIAFADADALALTEEMDNNLNLDG